MSPCCLHDRKDLRRVAGALERSFPHQPHAGTASIVYRNRGDVPAGERSLAVGFGDAAKPHFIPIEGKILFINRVRQISPPS
jgi:hypothetical protein